MVSLGDGGREDSALEPSRVLTRATIKGAYIISHVMQPTRAWLFQLQASRVENCLQCHRH